MDKNVIKKIILWQQEFVGKVKLQGRSISMEENANYVLVGIRRAGKSYMLYQKIQNLVAQGHSVEEILFVNFEDERISDIRKEELHLILEAYREMFSHQPIIFLDEIQNVEGWEHFARRLADEKYRVYITGSNAHMLSREISSTLGGRYLTKEIHPFSFEEYLEYQQVHLTKFWDLSPVKNDVLRLFSDYLGSAELISSHRQRVADVGPHSDDNDEKPPDFGQDKIKFPQELHHVFDEVAHSRPASCCLWKLGSYVIGSIDSLASTE